MPFADAVIAGSPVLVIFYDKLTQNPYPSDISSPLSGTSDPNPWFRVDYIHSQRPFHFEHNHQGNHPTYSWFCVFRICGTYRL